MAVQEWNQVDTYNLYQSDLRGVHYSLVLENVRSSRQAEENVVIDILEVGTRQGRNSCSCSPPQPASLPSSLPRGYRYLQSTRCFRL